MISWKKKSDKLNINNNTHIDSPKSSSTNNLLFPYKESMSAQSSSTIQGEEFNKGLISDSSSTLSNIFKGNSI